MLDAGFLSVKAQIDINKFPEEEKE